jgi:hypothetical protein
MFARGRHYALLMLLLLAATPIVRAATEAELRAAIIFNIARFVQWPPTALAADRFNICTVGSDAVVDGLAQLTDKSLHDLPVALRAVRRDAELEGCLVVYITSEQALKLAPISMQLQLSHTPGLTISDAPNFAASGGMVQLLTLDERQRFRINRHAAEKGGLAINAKLLQLSLPPGD